MVEKSGKDKTNDVTLPSCPLKANEKKVFFWSGVSFEAVNSRAFLMITKQGYLVHRVAF